MRRETPDYRDPSLPQIPACWVSSNPHPLQNIHTHTPLKLLSNEKIAVFFLHTVFPRLSAPGRLLILRLKRGALIGGGRLLQNIPNHVKNKKVIFQEKYKRVSKDNQSLTSKNEHLRFVYILSVVVTSRGNCPR